MNEKISLAGDLGSGKSTVSAILKEHLGAETYSTGAIVRDIATKRGMTVGELNVYMETHPEIDHEIDDGLKALSRDPRCLIIDSRMAWHFTEGTFKIYLSTDLETSARRILSAHRAEEQEASLDDMMHSIRCRRRSEEKRYFEQYGVYIKDLTNYDLVVDTSFATPDEIAHVILCAFAAWQRDKSYRQAYIGKDRLYATDAPEAQGGEPVAVELDGRFYLTHGTDAARAIAQRADTFVPVLLTHGDLHTDTYAPLERRTVC